MIIYWLQARLPHLTLAHPLLLACGYARDCRHQIQSHCAEDEEDWPESPFSHSLMSTKGGDMLFPLPDHQLPRVEIDPQTIAEWTAEGHDAVSRILMDRQSWFYRFDAADSRYTRAYDKNRTRGCMRVLPETNVVEYLVQGELHVSLKDLIYALNCETTHQLRTLFAQLYQTIGLDTAILQLYEGATADDPFNRVAMIWAALHPDMATARDFIQFDLSYTTKDAHGRTVLVNYRKSHDLRPDQLLQDHALDINRRYTHGITTYYADHSGQVVMTSMGHIPMENKCSTWALKIVVPSLYKRTLNYHGLVEAKALQQIGFTPDTLAERNSAQASMCRVCHKGFGLTRHRKWCRGCGHAICRNCNMEIALLKEGVQLGPRLPIVFTRFCLRCLLHANEQRIKRGLVHERLMAEDTPQLLWWESIDIVDGSSIDELIDLQRDDFYSYALKLGTDRRFSGATFSSTDSRHEDEHSLANASAKADNLALVTTSVAEHAARLRQMYQEQYTGKTSQFAGALSLET